MKSNKIISNILILLIVITFVFVVVNIFKINLFEGFNNVIKNDMYNEGNRSAEYIQNLNNNLGNVYNNTDQIKYKLNDISDNMFSDFDASRNFYNSSGNMITQILTKLNDLSLKIDTAYNLKCIADFGTQRGEKLSGGKGVLTGTEYVCPEELPICSGMVCDEKYGVCTK